MAVKKSSSTKTTADAKSAPADAAKASTTAKRTSTADGANGQAEAGASALLGGKPVTELGDDLVSGKKTAAAQAARIIDALLESEPEAVVPIIDRLVKAIVLEDKRPVQTAANALPIMARVAPARVARHLPRLKDAFDEATLVGKDGLVRTFAGLCIASVAYQKRLEGVLNKALAEADAKTLAKWTEIVLPALKGEPHARARATVEARLSRIPKAVAQKIADFLGIKLRLRY
ncbi:MAG TPA: hypothetical protein VIL20_21580 [Sandaracinaceae bacterium]